MKTALKTDVLDAVIFTGLGDPYPSWFQNLVLDECYIVEPFELRWLQSDETDDELKYDTLIPFQSVVIQNKYNEPYHIPFDQFAREFHGLDYGHAALNQNCVDYFVIEEFTPSSAFPSWLKEYIHDGVVVMDMDIQNLYDSTGEYRLKEDMVFVKSRHERVKCLSRKEFEEFFYVSYPDYN